MNQLVFWAPMAPLPRPNITLLAQTTWPIFNFNTNVSKTSHAITSHHLIPCDFRLGILGAIKHILIIILQVSPYIDQMRHWILQGFHCVRGYLFIDGIVDGNDGCVHCGKAINTLWIVYRIKFWSSRSRVMFRGGGGGRWSRYDMIDLLRLIMSIRMS